MEVKIEELPNFLKDSDFVDSLNNEDEHISIPNLKLDKKVIDLDDFIDLFNTMGFFGSRNYPKSFIKYYIENSEYVFNSLNNKDFKYDFLFRDLAKIKIYNPEQFFVTHKIIKKYNLNHENYNNYIKYVNNCHLDILKYNCIFFDEDNENISTKIINTSYIKIVSISKKNNMISVKIGIKNSYGDSVYTSQFYSESKDEFIDNIKNLLTAVKYNTLYKYVSSLNILSSSRIPVKYENGVLEFIEVHRGDGITTFTSFGVRINIFNKLLIIEELDHFLEFLEDYEL